MLTLGLGILLGLATARGQATTAVAATATATAASSEPASQPAQRSLSGLLDFPELVTREKLADWLFLLVAIIVAIAIGRVLSYILQLTAKRLQARGWNAYAVVFSGLASPANLALFTIGLGLGLMKLFQVHHRPDDVDPLADLKDFSDRVLLLLYTVAGFWYAFNLVAAVEVALRRISRRTETTLDDDLVPVIRKALRIFIVIIGALFILQNVFDRNIGAWLAGFGIAGLAVSLAAQDSLKNLFGSLTILFDRPFTMGQRIRFQSTDGTVEEIGFRSTKVRTADGSVVTIPNSQIVNESVDNWARRQTIFRTFSIGVVIETPAAKMREAVQIVRDILTSEEFRASVHDPDTKANVNPPRVYFDDFRPDALSIKIWYWFRSTDAWAYFDFTQRFNLRVMEEFEKAGIRFAYPTRRLIMEENPAKEPPEGVTAQPPPAPPSRPA